MKFYTDNAKLAQGVWMLAALGGIAAVAGFFAYDPVDPTITIAIAIGALFCIGMSVWMATLQKKGVAMEVGVDSIRIGETEILARDIESIRLYATLGTTSPIKPKYANLDAMVSLPPEPGLVGGLKVRTTDRSYSISAVKDIMSAYVEIRKFTDRIDAVYRLGNQERPFMGDRREESVAGGR